MVIEITGNEYLGVYSAMKDKISLHSCWTDTREDSQLTKWSINGVSDWLLAFETTNGNHQYFIQVK